MSEWIWRGKRVSEMTETEAKQALAQACYYIAQMNIEAMEHHRSARKQYW